MSSLSGQIPRRGAKPRPIMPFSALACSLPGPAGIFRNERRLEAPRHRGAARDLPHRGPVVAIRRRSDARRPHRPQRGRRRRAHHLVWRVQARDGARRSRAFSAPPDRLPSSAHDPWPPGPGYASALPDGLRADPAQACCSYQDIQLHRRAGFCGSHLPCPRCAHPAGAQPLRGQSGSHHRLAVDCLRRRAGPGRPDSSHPAAGRTPSLCRGRCRAGAPRQDAEPHRDRAREIWPPRWVVDGTRFSQWTGWSARTSLTATMAEAAAFYRRIGQL